MVNLKRTHYVMFILVITLFIASVLILVYAGVNWQIAIIDNALDSMQVSYNLILFSTASNPLIFTSKILAALIFPILTVLMAAWFFDFINNINIRERLTLSKINKLDGHVIIVPYNNFAKSMLKELRNSGIKAVTIAQNKKELFQLYKDGHLAIHGNIREIETFEVAKIEKAKGLIACSKDDVQNALVTMTAKTANPNIRIISRANKEESIKGLESAGAFKILIPEITAGEVIGKEISRKLLSRPGTKSLNLPAP